jgi:hypothetical protein
MRAAGGLQYVPDIVRAFLRTLQQVFPVGPKYLRALNMVDAELRVLDEALRGLPAGAPEAAEIYDRHLRALFGERWDVLRTAAGGNMGEAYAALRRVVNEELSRRYARGIRTLAERVKRDRLYNGPVVSDDPASEAYDRNQNYRQQWDDLMAAHADLFDPMADLLRARSRLVALRKVGALQSELEKQQERIANLRRAVEDQVGTRPLAELRKLHDEMARIRARSVWAQAGLLSDRRRRTVGLAEELAGLR